MFETSLGIRMDVEAALAYLLVPPLGGVVLLVFEHKSDYVRLVLPFLSFFLRSEDGKRRKWTVHEGLWKRKCVMRSLDLFC